MRLRNWAYRRGILKTYRLAVPVISIGNISVGGTGKTPLAESLLRFFLEQGLQPAYLSRGYGRETRGYLEVDPKKGSAKMYGDEAFQVAGKFPGIKIAVCEDRVAGGKQLLAAGGIDVLILDDAFQHRRIHRDLDIVVVDAGRLPWQDWVLPAGRLREPRSQLKRADFMVINKVDPDNLPVVPQAFQALPVAYATPEFTQLKTDHQTAIAFSGLGNNDFFKAQLEKAGVDLQAFFPFPDHYNLKEKDIAEIVRKFEEVSGKSGKLGPPLILTTEKDYARLQGRAEFKALTALPLQPVPIELRWIKGGEALQKRLKNTVS